MKLKVCIVLLVASINLHGAAPTDGTQILYSINMPGNPFQQPYYQMMIKADNKNRSYSLSSTKQPQIHTFNACSYEGGCGSHWNPQTVVTSDYVSLYADDQNRLSMIYGLSPYTYRGYVEGAALTLYMQRPAQVQLPFNPLAQMNSQNGTPSPYIYATLPDYSDVFLAQTSGDIYQSLQCTSNNCTLQNNTTPMPSWYTYIPRTYNVTRGVSAILYGTIASLSRPQPHTSFSPYTEKIPWGAVIAMGVSKMSSTGELPSVPQILSEGAFAQKSWLRSQSTVNGSSSLQFMPIISPGYAGDAVPYRDKCVKRLDPLKRPCVSNTDINPTDPLQSVLATGDLTGNYSVNNTNNPYIVPGIQATTYDGSALTNGMSYFQLFAQNMQWFSLQTPLQTPLPRLSSTIPQNITPGQGIFSDAIQLAAMEAPALVTLASVFTGSVTPQPLTGPVMTKVKAVTSDTTIGVVNIPMAFLSELTVASFKVGRYLQTPLASQMNGTWSGGLVLAASEDPLQYYQGVTSSANELPPMPYLPIYFSDPGRKLDKEFKPGWSYCPLSLFSGPATSQMCYDTAASPMTNFYDALNGTR